MTADALLRFGVAFGLAVMVSACARGCDEGDGRSSEGGTPSLPLPPLVHDPDPVDGGAEAPNFQARLRAMPLRHGVRADTVELRPARAGDATADAAPRTPSVSSESVGVAAVTFFHASFAKAHPGFTLTRPQLLAPAELFVLANDLSEMAMTVLAASDLAAAKARWPNNATLAEIDRDDEWAATRPVLAETARALSAKAKAHADAKESLWVLAL